MFIVAIDMFIVAIDMFIVAIDMFIVAIDMFIVAIHYRGYSFPLGKYATVFQTEIYAILQCAYEIKVRTIKAHWLFQHLKDRQCTVRIDVTLRSVRITIVLVEKH
jgi:hypothetical protein